VRTLVKMNRPGNLADGAGVAVRAELTLGDAPVGHHGRWWSGSRWEIDCGVPTGNRRGKAGCLTR
jgi:hypothetical protein